MKIVILIFLLSVSLYVKAQVHPFYSAANDKYGFKDATGKVVITPRYDLAYSAEEGMCAVRLNAKYGYVDQNGTELVPPKYDYTWKFIGGYAAVKLGNKYGFIDLKGKEVIPPCYENANNYHGTCCYKGMAQVRQHGKWKLIKINPTL